MPSRIVINFMKQQGFQGESPESCNMHFAGLYFQPWIVFPLTLLGIALTAVDRPSAAATLFLFLSGVLWWNTLAPRFNPFELIYNRFVAPRGGPLLTPAPAPRRFAQGMAVSFLLGAAVTLLAGVPRVSWVLQGLLVVAFSALLVGRFCLGAYVYHLLRGQFAFANATLPWARG